MIRNALRAPLAILVSALLLPLTGASRAEEPDADEIVQRMQAAYWQGKDMRARMQVTATNSYGERVYLSASYYRLGDKLQRIVLDNPPDLRGFEFSAESRDSEPPRVHVYMPVVRRVRELDVNMRKESFLGTDFNYEDLGFEDLSSQKHTLIGKVESKGRSYYQIESKPKDDWMYSKLVRLIERDSFLPIVTEYHCWGTGLCKVREIERIERIGDYEIPTVVSMTDTFRHLVTEITLDNVEVDVGLPATLFHCHGDRMECPEP
jgi:hypothetical protein